MIGPDRTSIGQLCASCRPAFEAHISHTCFGRHVIAFATHNNGPGPVIVDAEVFESQAALWTNKRCPVAKFTLGSFARASVVVNDRFFRHVGTPARAAQL